MDPTDRNWIVQAIDNAITQTERHNAERAYGSSARNIELREAREVVAKMLKMPSDALAYKQP